MMKKNPYLRVGLMNAFLLYMFVYVSALFQNRVFSVNFAQITDPIPLLWEPFVCIITKVVSILRLK